MGEHQNWHYGHFFGCILALFGVYEFIATPSHPPSRPTRYYDNRYAFIVTLIYGIIQYMYQQAADPP